MLSPFAFEDMHEHTISCKGAGLAVHHVYVMPKHKLNAHSMDILAGKIDLDQSVYIPVTNSSKTIRDQRKMKAPNSSTKVFACSILPP